MNYPRRKKATDNLLFPLLVLIDQREKLPYDFRGIISNADKGRVEIDVPVDLVHLETGDYTLQGHEANLCLERKSLSDLFSTLGQHRERFEAELVRMASIPRAHIVVEAELSTIMNDPPILSQLSPKAVLRSILAWIHRYPNIHWHLLPGRDCAEVWTFRILERYFYELPNPTKEPKLCAAN